MHVVNTFRTSKGPPKVCIDLEGDWLLILDEVGGKSPGDDSKIKMVHISIFRSRFKKIL